jgi:hypothetical protein
MSRMAGTRECSMRETTSTLLCGDVFTAQANSPALTEQEIVSSALAAEDVFRATCLTPFTGPTIRSLADLRPETLGLMHGPPYAGDCGRDEIAR